MAFTVNYEVDDAGWPDIRLEDDTGLLKINITIDGDMILDGAGEDLARNIASLFWHDFTEIRIQRILDIANMVKKRDVHTDVP